MTKQQLTTQSKHVLIIADGEKAYYYKFQNSTPLKVIK